MLALAIFGAALAILAQVVSVGGEASLSAREAAMTRLLCQSKMSEILAANIQPVGVSATPIPGPDAESTTVYQYSVDVMQTSVNGLLTVRVTVQASSTDGGPPLAQYGITRWMIDPMLGLEQAEAEAQAGQNSGLGGRP